MKWRVESGSLVLWFLGRILYFRLLLENLYEGRTQPERMNTPVVDESSRHQTAEAAFFPEFEADPSETTEWLCLVFEKGLFAKKHGLSPLLLSRRTW